jgi:pimeloyl-ACP methyl ester carboxylesterase
MRAFENRSDELLAYFPRQDRTNSKLAVFIHGFLGEYLSTWGALPDLLHQNADSTEPFAAWDYVFLGYRTRHTKGYLDISDLLLTQLRRASDGGRPYARKYSQFALFGHSLGTLGIRQLLCICAAHEPGLIRLIGAVTLFGSPGDGSPLAPIAAPFLQAGEALKPGNQQLRMLRKWTAGASLSANWPAPRLVMGKGDRVVGAESMPFDGDNPRVFHSNFGHFGLVKPNSWSHSEVIGIVAEALQ